jgi:hypothetical protein
MWSRATYEEIRPRMRAGDGIAFGGHGFVSNFIKHWTRPSFWKFWQDSPLSHWATVLRMDSEGRVYLIESTQLNEKNGVQVNLASTRIEQYDGIVFWLPLAQKQHDKFDHKRFNEFMQALDKKQIPYDDMLIAHLLFDRFNLFQSKEDWSKFICSELGAAIGKSANILPLNLNTSEVTPQRMAEFDIWGSIYYQLKGKDRRIDRYSSRVV